MSAFLKRSNIIFILSAPSGTGKTTIIKNILNKLSDITPSISVTTRTARSSEKNEKDYIFVNEANFQEMVSKGEFLEYATIAGNLYGTKKESIQKILHKNVDVLFDINWEGMEQIKRTWERENHNIARIVTIFILPPSKHDLLKRIKLRNNDSDESIRKRLEMANVDIQKCIKYDYIVVNDDIRKAIRNVSSIIIGERLRSFDYLNKEEIINTFINQKAL